MDEILIPRRGHKKSRTGCRSCKVRKVKCDERRPLCLNCERHFYNLKVCDFDDPPPSGHTYARHQKNDQIATGRSKHYRPSTDNLHRFVQNGETVYQIAPAISSGRLDPFEMRPESRQMASRIDGLMNHYLHDFAFRSFPFYASRSLIELWWPFVRSDDVLFHVTMLLSDIDQDQFTPRTNAYRTRELLDECYHLLNNRLDDPIKSIDDHTTVAIASLAAMEHNRGNMRTLNMHLQGLKRIVELRGGLEKMRQTNPMAANYIFWCAMVSIDEPSLLPTAYSIRLPEPDWLNNIEMATLWTHDGSEADLLSVGVDIATANILHEIQRVSRLYTTMVISDAAANAVDILSHLCSILQRLIEMSRNPTDVSAIPGLSQSCRLAGCLHIFTPLSAYFPNPTLMLQALVRDLKASLTLTIHDIGTESHLLLWLLCVGGVTAHAMPERAWYVGHLVVAITDLGVHTWEQMRQHLVQLAFHSNFCDLSFHALWLEVRQKQEHLGVITEP